VGDVDRVLSCHPRAGGRLAEAELRRQVSGAIWRALADPRFARALLANPETALGSVRCTPYQRWALQTIRAPTIRDLAAQLEVLFWEVDYPVRSAWVHLARAAGQ
jgi:hypothetical protein